MTDADLMAKIQQQWGAAIRNAVAGTPLPPMLLAAIAANESSGDPAATRFESGVAGQISHVLSGYGPRNFGSITAQQLTAAVTADVSSMATALSTVMRNLVELATSWGPMQIMGYQTIPQYMRVSDLVNIEKHFHVGVQMLAAFVRDWKLSIPTQAGDPEWTHYFRCWNTGRPDGTTTDPDYVSKGQARMILFSRLP